MSNFVDFLAKMAVDLYYGEGDTDNPTCPNCGGTMSFHGGDRPIGEGYWDCPCGYSFTEDDLDGDDD